jgi:hypothetical protein
VRKDPVQDAGLGEMGDAGHAFMMPYRRGRGGQPFWNPSFSEAV